MDHYLDLRMRADPEFTVPVLLSTTFGRLHLALVNLQANDIGISFPNLDAKARYLGDTLRLHSSEAKLVQLMAMPWWVPLKDQVRLGEVAPIPTTTSYRNVSRQQIKSNPERLRRRQMKRHNLTEEQALERIPQEVGKRLDLPYLQARSLSTGQPFRLFIRHGPLQSSPVDGQFNAYGTSQTATVPWF